MHESQTHLLFNVATVHQQKNKCDNDRTSYIQTEVLKVAPSCVMIWIKDATAWITLLKLFYIYIWHFQLQLTSMKKSPLISVGVEMFYGCMELKIMQVLSPQNKLRPNWWTTWVKPEQCMERIRKFTELNLGTSWRDHHITACTVKHAYSKHAYNELTLIVRWISFPVSFKHLV